MIIDSHTHIGKFLNFDLEEKVLLEGLKKYGISFALVSNLEGGEVDHQQKEIPILEQHSQIETNKRLLKIVRKNKDKLGALIWIRPRNEECNVELEKLIEENLDIIYGIKVHPYHSKFPFNDKKMFAYFKLAEKYNLPVVTHTAVDKDSHPRLVYEVAKLFPNVNFVMCHMGLATDNEEAIELIAKLPNLYGDTTWVPLDKVKKAIKICGKEKILFGTDAPINGMDIYKNEYYKDYFNKKTNLSKEVLENLLYKNALKLFNIKID